MENESYHSTKLRDILNDNITSKISTVQKALVEFRSNFQNNAQTIIDSVSLILNSVEEQVLQDLRQQLSEIEGGLRNQIEPELQGRLETEITQRVTSQIETRVAAAKHEASVSSEDRSRLKLSSLNEALHQISLRKTQVDILTGFLDQAALFVPRVALFVIKSGSIVGWQARGFEGDFSNDSIRSLVFPPGRDSLLRQVYDSRAAFKGDTTSDPAIQELVFYFGPLAPDSVCAIPLVVRDKPVAIVYADSGLVPNFVLDSSVLEIMTIVVSLTVELNSARAKLGTEATSAAQPKAEETHSAAATDKAEKSVPQERSSPSPVEATARPAGTSTPLKEAAPEPPIREPSRISEITVAPMDLGGSSQQVPESSRPSEPVPTSPRSFSSPSAGTTDEVEQKQHNEARRFARLLVSEIKLYNEQKVLEGRQERNLYGLLRDDIDKSREMYEKRASPTVAAKVDYFYDELVRILADNQAEVLGKDCPGPVLLTR
jgi:hypothetical protein